MGDLDDLAAATHGSEKQFNKSAALQPNGARKRPAALLGVFGAAILVVAFGTWAIYAGRSSERRDINQQRAEWVRQWLGAGERGDADSGFTVNIENFSTENTLVSEWITVENKTDRPLVVSRVSLNGECDAPRANHLYGYCVRGADAPLPVTVTIGESTYFFIYNINELVPLYKKDVVYVELKTDRGNFRYTPGSGLTKR